jgi:hypothetical protein
MDERASGLTGKIETWKLQHMGITEAELAVELSSDLMAEIAKRGRKYGVALAPVWKVRGKGAEVILAEDPLRFGGRLNGVALIADDAEIAKRLAQYLREVFEESAVKKAEAEGPKDSYKIHLDVRDVDLSKMGEVIADVEKWRRLHYQRDKWDEIPDYTTPELDELRERVKWTVMTDEELERALEKKWRIVVEKLEEANGELRSQIARLEDAIKELVESTGLTEDKIANLTYAQEVQEILSKKEEDDP